MRFLFVRPAFCLRLPSDSVSRQTPLPSGYQFPLSGLEGTSTPKFVRPAGRTTKKTTATVLSAFCLQAFSLGLPSMAKADLPDGIIALSDDKLTLLEAGKFCRQQEGRLPLVNGADFLEGYDDADKEQVTTDGFSNIGAAWPDGLPGEFFWTGTKAEKDNPNLVYLINSGDGHVRADIFYDVNYTELTAFAVCVPSDNAGGAGGLIVTDTAQAENFLKEASKAEAQDIMVNGGKPDYVYKGEGEIGDCKAWYFDLGTAVAGKFTAEYRYSVNCGERTSSASGWNYPLSKDCTPCSSTWRCSGKYAVRLPAVSRPGNLTCIVLPLEQPARHCMSMNAKPKGKDG
jgi:hypothetical protein